MIHPSTLTPSDIGRMVAYRGFDGNEYGELTSWNNKFVFVKFKGPNGEACLPEDVSFTNESNKPCTPNS